jgi:hexosaminidase
MKKSLLASLLFLSTFAFAAKPVVLPALRQWQEGDGSIYTLPEAPRILFDRAHEALVGPIESFAKEIQATPLDLTREAVKKGDIRIYLDSQALPHQEGYILEVTPEGIILTAPTVQGAYWGTRSLLQVFQRENNTFPSGCAIDWPDYAVRSFMFDCGRKPFALSTLQKLVDICAYYKMNDLQLHLTDNYIWLHNYPGVKTPQDALKIEPSAGAFRLESSIKGLASTDIAYSKAQFKALVAYAKTKGVTIVPEIDVPGHALAMVRVRPDLMYKGSVGKKHPCERAAMLDLDNPETFPFVARIFDEYIDEGVFASDIIHIGTDEYYGDAESYRAFTDKLLKHIIAKGKTPRFWGSLRAKQGKTPVVVEGTQMHVWSLDWQDPRQAVKEGYDIINILDAHAYVVPNGTGNIGPYGDDLDMRPIYETWSPGTFKRRQTNWSIDATDPHLLGAAWAVWNDNSFLTDPGLCGRDLLPMIQKNCAVFAHRTWARENALSFDAFMAEVARQATVLRTEKPQPWQRTYTLTACAKTHCLAQSDELALYASLPTNGQVGFWREGAYYSFPVKLEPGKTYDLTFASKDRKASLLVVCKDEGSSPVLYQDAERQHYPEACRYTTLPPIEE